MLTTAHEMFTEAIRNLAPAERLRLAALLLDDLAESHLAVVDASDSRTPKDQADLMAYSLRHAATLYPEERDLA